MFAWSFVAERESSDLWLCVSVGWTGAKSISAECCQLLARCADTGVSWLLLSEMEMVSFLSEWDLPINNRDLKVCA